MMLRIILAAAVTLSASALAAFHSNDTACTRSYTVVEGDTCDRVGQKTLTSTYQILAFNLPKAGPNCYTLEIGAELCLGKYGNDCQFVHQCSNADTCASIASNYGISTQRLQSNNPTLNCDIVYEGLMLCVSAGSIHPPADDSLNSTNVMAASEAARQAWLANTKTKRHAAPQQGEPDAFERNGINAINDKMRLAESIPIDLPGSDSSSPMLAPEWHSHRQHAAHQQRHRSISTLSHHRSHSA